MVSRKRKRRNSRQLDFQRTVKKISEIFHQYSVEDIACALFISCMWLPNITSPTQHQLLTIIFASLNPEQYRANKKIKSYQDFKLLLETIYPLLPSFPLLEDYIPYLDWGEVKYHHSSKDYRIFYGCELEDPYDLLQLYETVYCPFNEEYVRFTSRSPIEELKLSLILQDKLIRAIDGLPKDLETTKVSLGGKQIPPQYFWSAAKSFFTSFDPQEVLGNDFLDKYSLDIGELYVDFSSSKSFEQTAFEDQILPYMFLHWKGRYLLVLPRRITSVLLDSWSTVFGQFKDQILGNEYRRHLRISMEVYKYLKTRIRSDNLFGLVNAVDQENNAHEVLFSTTFIAKDRLVLIYVARSHLKNG